MGNVMGVKEGVSAMEAVSFEELRPGMKVEGLACSWTILSIPFEGEKHPMWGPRMKVKARCEWKGPDYAPKDVYLEGYASEEVEVALEEVGG